MSKIAPVLTTSERRKNTIVSPSVCAGRHVKQLHGLAVREERPLRREVGVGRPGVRRRCCLRVMRLSTLRWAMIDARVSRPRGSIESITRM